MEVISCDQSTSPPARYESFITENLKSLDQYCGSNELKGSKIEACFHGWVILSDQITDSVMWSLWNPLTSKLICLPPLTYRGGEEEEEEEEEEEDFYECCLSSPPGDKDSVFMLLSGTTPSVVFCQLDHKTKRLKWTRMSYAEQLLSMSGINGVQLEKPTCYHGKVYAKTDDVNYPYVIQFDIEVKGTEVAIRLLPFVETPHAFFSCFPSRNSFCGIRSFLKGSCTELFYIEVSLLDETRIGVVSLFKLDMAGLKWEKVEDLKDAIFFIELSTCSVFYKSVVAEIGGYIHIQDDMDKITYSFYVKDRTMSLSSISCTLRENQALVWTMLECGFYVDLRESKQQEKGKDTELVVRPVKPDVAEFDSIATEPCLLNVPFHILEKIMEQCVGVEYMKFRATCKRCHLAAPLIQRSNETTLRRWQIYSVVSPWLMVLDTYRGVITFIDPICSDKYFIKTPRELKGDCSVYCSRYDLDSCSKDLYFYPIPTFSSRDVYVLCNNERIEVVRDTGENDYSTVVVADKIPRSRSTSLTEYFLSECDQHLFLVIVGKFEETVEVFKLNRSTKEWGKIYSLGKYMIYISYASCICLEAKSS